MNLRPGDLSDSRGSLGDDRRSTRVVPTAEHRRLHASALRLRRLSNLAPTLLLRSPLHRLMSRRFLLLTYQGRRTGRSYTLPAAYPVAVRGGALDSHDLPQVGHLLPAGILTGNESGGWVAVHPALNTPPPSSRLPAEQAVHRCYGRIRPVLMTATLAAAGSTLARSPTRRPRTASPWAPPATPRSRNHPHPQRADQPGTARPAGHP